MTDVFNVCGTALAVVVVILCLDRLRQVNWTTHKGRYVATPLLFLTWALFFGVDSAKGHSEPYEILAALGIIGWLLSTFKTWVSGPPSYTERGKP